jgi:hypothetical protein
MRFNQQGKKTSPFVSREDFDAWRLSKMEDITANFLCSELNPRSTTVLCYPS